MRISQRIASMSLSAACCASVGLPACAQDYPAKPVRIITAGAGTFHDVVTRQIGQRLSQRWGQPVVVENQPGAALTIGTGMTARAMPDGYTLVMSDRSALAVAPHLFKSIPYDPAKDLSPITLAALAPTMLVAHRSIPANTVQEFLSYAKQQPVEIHFASAGPGTNAHVALELFKHATGAKVAPIHYKGGGAATAAILSGEVKAGFGNVPNVLPHVKAGKLKSYVVTGRQRFPGAPETPTAAEAGLQGFELEFWIGLLAPSRTPGAIVAQLNRDVIEILRTPALQATLLAQGAVPAPGTPEEFRAFMAAESARMKKLVEQTGMRAE